MLGHGAIGQFAIGEAGEIYGISWFEPLSIFPGLPLGLGAPYQLFYAADALLFRPPSADTLTSWLKPFAEPVRLPIGLKAPYHPDLFYHPRLLPTPDVTLVMDAVEISNDIAVLSIDISDGVYFARVSITELAARQDAALSVREP